MSVDPTETPALSSVNDEIAAMRKLTNALDGLDDATRQRVLRWFVDRCRQPAATGVALGATISEAT